MFFFLVVTGGALSQYRRSLFDQSQVLTAALGLDPERTSKHLGFCLFVATVARIGWWQKFLVCRIGVIDIRTGGI